MNYADELDPNEFRAWREQIEQDPFDSTTRRAHADWLRDRGYDTYADFHQSMADWFDRHRQQGTSPLAESHPRPIWMAGGRMGYPEGTKQRMRNVAEFDLPEDHGAGFAPSTEPHHPVGDWNGTWVGPNDPYHFLWDDYGNFEEALRRAFVNMRTRGGQTNASRYSRVNYADAIDPADVNDTGFLHPKKYPLAEHKAWSEFGLHTYRPVPSGNGWTWDLHEHHARATSPTVDEISAHLGIPWDHPDFEDAAGKAFERDDHLQGKPVDPHFMFQATGGKYGEPHEIDWRHNETLPEDFFAMSRYSTTEDDFHAMLDANPDDHHTRQVFADWLEERGDRRAAGYRALGMLRRAPYQQQENRRPLFTWGHEDNSAVGNYSEAMGLNPEWLWATQSNHPDYENEYWWRHHPSRRAAEDAAAFGFASLPPETQKHILKPAQMSRYGRTDYSHEAFQRALRENPNDLTAAKVYADWIEENDPASAAPGMTSAIPTGPGRPPTLETLRTATGPVWTELWPQQIKGQGLIPQVHAGPAYTWEDFASSPRTPMFFVPQGQYGPSPHGDPYHGIGGTYFVTENTMVGAHPPRYLVWKHNPPGEYNEGNHSAHVSFRTPEDAHEFALGSARPSERTPRWEALFNGETGDDYSRYSRTDYADHSDFERAIDENPLDATNHLVYADWLDEQHQETGDPLYAEEAAFRRSIGDWFVKYPPETMANPVRRDLLQWQVGTDDDNFLPEGVTASDIPTMLSLGRGESSGPHHAIVLQRAYRPPNLGWRTYRGMEEALRRAHRAGLRANPPEQMSRYERRHAPTGFDYEGKPYRRGQFIPGTVLFQHTPKRAYERWRPHQVEYATQREPDGGVPWPALTPVPDARNQEPQPASLSDAIEAIGPLLAPQPALRRPKDHWGRDFDDEMLNWGRRDEEVAAELRGLVHPDDADVLEQHLDLGSDAGIIDLREAQPAAGPNVESVDPRVMSKVKDIREMMGWSDPGYVDRYLEGLSPSLRADVTGFMGLGQGPPAVQPAGPQLDPEVLDQLGRLVQLKSHPSFPSAVGDYLDMMGAEHAEKIAGALGVNPDPLSITESLRGGLPQALTQRPEPVPDVPKNPDAERIATHPVAAAERLGKGANGAVLLTFADPEASQAVFKAADSEGYLRSGIRPGTYYRREVAAHYVANILGMGDLVPATAFRQHDGKTGSVQRFVPDAAEAEEVDEDSRHDGPLDAARAAVFDYVIAHADRHDSNWLVAGQSDFDNPGKLVLIDNGLSMPTKYHKNDFFNVEFWENAVNRDLPMPDVTAMRGKWPQIERALLEAQIEPPAIELTRQRYENVVSGLYPTFGDLPVFFRGNGRLNMRMLYRRRT